jgi:hypothetical protein
LADLYGLLVEVELAVAVELDLVTPSGVLSDSHEYIIRWYD